MTRIDELLARTLAELDPLVKSLASVRADEPAEKQSAANADAAEVRQLVMAIKSLLDDSDSDAVEAVERLAGLVKGTSMSGPVARVSAAVADFDFDAALQELEKLEIA